MKCIFVCDQNKAYSGFWKPQAEHMFRAFGLHSVLYYITDESDHNMFTSEYATVEIVPLISEIPRVVQALFAKWYFPCKRSSDEHILICDIDCFILSKTFINDIQSDSSTIFHLSHYGDGLLPGYYVYGRPAQLEAFFNVENITFSDFCKSIVNSKTIQFCTDASSYSKNATPDWKYFCTEERYAYACSLKNTQPVRSDTKHPEPGQKRICRSMSCEYSLEKLKAGMYTDFHCPRPYEEHETKITEIVQASYNK